GGRRLWPPGGHPGFPDTNPLGGAAALAEETGWTVPRGRLEDYTEPAVAAADGTDARFTGELVGGRMTNLLPGVWSSRLGLKLRNRRAGTAPGRWAGPAAACGPAPGRPCGR